MSWITNIKNIFSNAKATYNPNHWEEISNALDNKAIDEKQSEQKYKSQLSAASIPFSAEEIAVNWSKIESKLNADISFEKRIKEKFDNAAIKDKPKGFEKVAEAIKNKKLTPQERIMQSILNSGKAPYNPKHWELFVKANYIGRKKWLVAASLITLLSLSGIGAYYFNSNLNESENVLVSNSDTTISKPRNSEIKTNQELNKKNKSINYNTNEIKEKQNTNFNYQVKSYSNNKSTKNKTDNSIGKSQGKSGLTNSKINKNISGTNLDNNPTLVPNPKNTYEVVDNNDQSKTISNENNSEFNLIEENINLDKNQYEIINLNQRKQFITFQSNPKKVERQSLEIKTPELNYHLGYVDIFGNNNSADIVGWFGDNMIFIGYNQQWEKTYIDNKISSINTTLPITTNLNFEKKLSNNFQIGLGLQRVNKDNWLLNRYEGQLAYQINLKKSKIKLGLGLNHEVDKIISNKLTLRQQIALTNEVSESELQKGIIKPNKKTSIQISTGYYHKLFFSRLNFHNQPIYSNRSILENQSVLQFDAGINFAKLKNINSSIIGGYTLSTINIYQIGTSISYNEKIAINTTYDSNKNIRFNLINKFKQFRSNIYWNSQIFKKELSLSEISYLNGDFGLIVYYKW